MKFLRDEEKRLLLVAIRREQEVCKKVDAEPCGGADDFSLESVCKGLYEKFMYDRLFKKIYRQALKDLRIEIEKDVYTANGLQNVVNFADIEFSIEHLDRLCSNW